VKTTKFCTRSGFSFWYRNLEQPRQSSLGIAYHSGEQYDIVRPDFIFFATQVDATVVADVVDPHSLHLADESVAEAMGKLRVLDLANEDVRKGVAIAKEAACLFTRGPGGNTELSRGLTRHSIWGKNYSRRLDGICTRQTGKAILTASQEDSPSTERHQDRKHPTMQAAPTEYQKKWTGQARFVHQCANFDGQSEDAYLIDLTKHTHCP
jgi:hypothetical protein